MRAIRPWSLLVSPTWELRDQASRLLVTRLSQAPEWTPGAGAKVRTVFPCLVLVWPMWESENQAFLTVFPRPLRRQNGHLGLVPGYVRYFPQLLLCTGIVYLVAKVQSIANCCFPVFFQQPNLRLGIGVRVQLYFRGYH